MKRHFLWRLCAWLILFLHPLTRACGQTPQYQTDQPAVTQSLNDFWTLQGLGRPADHVTPNWAALLGSSDWFEWNSLKVDWSSDSADKMAQRGLLQNAKITGVNAAGAQAKGYVWPSNGSESWICPSAHFDQMPRFICAVYNDYLWSRDRTFLKTMQPKVEAVMDYMTQTMGGRSGLLVCPGVYTGLSETGPNTTYMDCYREGGSVTWIEAGYYTALQDMAEIETALGRPAVGTRYAALARRLPARFDAQLWNGRTHRYAGWRDSHGGLHDYGFTYVNLEALARGLGNASRAGDIFDWIDNGEAQPAVMGGHVGSRDIYQCVVAPRSNTAPIPDADWAPWSVPPTLRRSTMGYGALVEDGGAMLWVDYYDVLARLRWLDADSAWQKFTDMLGRVEGDRLRFTESVRDPTNSYGENYLEVGPADGPENGIDGTLPLYGFLGIRPEPGGLSVSPDLPTSVLTLAARDVCYDSSLSDIRVSRGRVVAESRPDATGLLLQARSPFNKIGLCRADTKTPTTATVWLEKRTQRPGGAAWTSVASFRHTFRARNSYEYAAVPVQAAGTYRIVWHSRGGLQGCRAVFEPRSPIAAGAIRGPDTTFRAKQTFSALNIGTPHRSAGRVALFRKLGSHWFPVSAAWATGGTGGVLSFADQRAGIYRLRSAPARRGVYRLLSHSYTVEVSSGMVTTKSTVAAGQSVRLAVCGCSGRASDRDPISGERLGRRRGGSPGRLRGSVRRVSGRNRRV